MKPLNRRQFLTKTGQLLATLPFVFAPFAQAETPAQPLKNPPPSLTKGEQKMKIICVEEHVLDPTLNKAAMPTALQQAPFLPDWGKRITDGNNPDRSRPQVIAAADSARKGADMGEARLQDMDAAGIDMQILSYGGFPQFAPAELHQAANDRMAETIAAHPTRFAGFATLPWVEPDLAVKELKRAVTQLGLKGALLNGRPSDDFLDHPRYAELLATFNDLKVPLYLHPSIPVPAVQQAYYSGFDPEVTARLSMFGWGWHNEAGIHLLRLMLSGALDNNRHLQIISGHWGEMLPFYLQRLDDSIPQAASGLARSLTQTFCDQVYVTPSGMLTEPHFKFIYDLVGADRILYSVDYPYQSLDGARAFLENLAIPQEDKELIAYKNAERVLGLKGIVDKSAVGFGGDLGLLEK